MKRAAAAILILGWAVHSAQCAEPMAPFNEVDKFRILTLVTEPPSLAEGEIAEISPLLAADDGNLEGVTYKWSWCPIAVNAANGATCAISEEDFRKIAETLVRTSGNEQAEALLENVPISFSLGENPTAQFVYALPSDLLSQVCDALMADDSLGVSDILNCKEKLDAVIRLEVTRGEVTAIAYKEIPLFLDAERADNENPEILGLRLTDTKGREVSLDADLPVLYRGETYDMKADIDDAASEQFVPFPTKDNPNPSSVKETLFVTWFFTAGETDAMRTSYIEDEVSMDVLRSNRFKTPGTEDFEEDRIELFLVLQDERCGAGTWSKQFSLKER